MSAPLFEAAFPYQQDVLALPVTDLDDAARWYSKAFGLSEVERRTSPHPAVILARDGVHMGFAINGGDASQDGAAILVSDIHRAPGRNSRPTASRSTTGAWMSATGSSCRSSSSSRPTVSVTTFISPSKGVRISPEGVSLQA